MSATEPQTRDDRTETKDNAESDDVEAADAIAGAPHMAEVLVSKGNTLSDLEGFLNTDTAAYAALWATYPTFPEINNEAAADDAPRHAQTFLFDAALSADGGSDTDSSVDLTFTAIYEYENRYGQTKTVIEAPNPWDVDDTLAADTDADEYHMGTEWDDDANEVAVKPNAVVKALIWNEHHYNFQKSGDSGPVEDNWTLDQSGVEPLRKAVEEAGYEWKDERGRDADEYTADDPDGLDRVTAFAEEGDTVTIRYEMKNGNGIGEKTGVVTQSVPGDEKNEDGYTPTQEIDIERDDGNETELKREDNGDPGVFSSGYYPYMGEPVAVEVIPDDSDGEGDEWPWQ